MKELSSLEVQHVSGGFLGSGTLTNFAAASGAYLCSWFISAEEIVLAAEGLFVLLLVDLIL